jgi:uncharacterized protein
MRTNIEHYNFIEKLKKLSFIEAIYLYGSRARGDNQERSDIDLAIVCPAANESDWLKVLKIIDEADTLLSIDCVRYDALENLLLKNNIDRDRLILFKRDKIYD